METIGQAVALSHDRLRSSPEIRAAAVQALETLDAEIEALETSLARNGGNGAAAELTATIEELSALWLTLSEATAEIDFVFEGEADASQKRSDG